MSAAADDRPEVEPVRFEPPPDELSAPFWEATREGRLVLPWCRTCDRPHWYPRRRCPSCHGSDLEWRTSLGEGRVHAVSVQHRPQWPGLVDRAPYAVVLVELAEGVRMLAGITGAAADEVAVDQPVHLVWEDLSDGRRLPMFAPA